jgi:hypothetical protein
MDVLQVSRRKFCELELPFYQVGKSKRYKLEEVLAHLKQEPEPVVEITRAKPKRSGYNRNDARYAEMLGLKI